MLVLLFFASSSRCHGLVLMCDCGISWSNSLDFWNYHIQSVTCQSLGSMAFNCECGKFFKSQGHKSSQASDGSKIVKVSKGAKIRNRYNQVPHLTQDTNGKVTNSLLDSVSTNESQEVSPFQAGDHKTHINRRAQRHSKHKTEKT